MNIGVMVRLLSQILDELKEIKSLLQAQAPVADEPVAAVKKTTTRKAPAKKATSK